MLQHVSIPTSTCEISTTAAGVESRPNATGGVAGAAPAATSGGRTTGLGQTLRVNHEAIDAMPSSPASLVGASGRARPLTFRLDFRACYLGERRQRGLICMRVTSDTMNVDPETRVLVVISCLHTSSIS